MSDAEHSVTQELQSWLANAGPVGAGPEADAHMLERHARDGERLLAKLPSRSTRSAAQQVIADSIHRSSRLMRDRFMRAHAPWVYNTMTRGCLQRMRLAELAYIAAEMFPGLVPTREQIERERTFLQADKEAREIDQGIFFSALLDDPECGQHLIESQLQPTVRALTLLSDFRRNGHIDLGKVRIERRGSTAYLTVHNEECLNAEDDQLADDMETAVDLTLLDDATRVCVLRGCYMTHPKYKGRRVFSAGINIRELHCGQISYISFLLRRELTYISKIQRGLRCEDQSSYRGFRQIEKPWVAGVDTFAIGGGAQLLLVFDHVVAAADSYFSLPAAQEGIVPGVANLRLSRAVGARMSRQIILSGRKIWAHDPEARFLIDDVVEPAEMDAAIERIAASLSSPAVIANRHMLVNSEEPIEQFRAYMAQFASVQAERLYSQDVLDKVRRS